MRILVIDSQAEMRDLLSSRLEEALRQAGIKRAQLVQAEQGALSLTTAGRVPDVAFLGPACYEDLDESVSRFRALYPSVPFAIVLENKVYTAEAVELRKNISARIMPLADLAQMAQFLLDCDSQLTKTTGVRNSGVISVVHFKGGVGASTVAATLASCWASHGVSVALVDLDDVNPQLSDWARLGGAQRGLVAELLRKGEVPRHRVRELVSPVDGYDGRFVVCGQPENYAEGFHFKADVLAQAPSSAEFTESLLWALQDEFDLVVVDCAKSWGISTFASMLQSQKVLLVTDDQPLSLRRSLDVFLRFYRESDDPAEFDLGKWSIILNAYTGRALLSTDLRREVEELDLFPEAFDLFPIPFSRSGREWGMGSETLYKLAEEDVQQAIRSAAFALSPFRYEHADEGISAKLKRNLQRMITP